MMSWSDHDMSGWGYAGMAVGMVLFWVLVILGIVFLVRFTSGATQVTTAPQLPSSESPEQVLASRFARGEIDESEFQRRLAVLREAARR